MIDIQNLSLSTPLFHYYYGEGEIQEIKKELVKVEFSCKFLKNKFFLVFVKDINTGSYTTENKRHISELSLVKFT